MIGSQRTQDRVQTSTAPEPRGSKGRRLAVIVGATVLVAAIGVSTALVVGNDTPASIAPTVVTGDRDKAALEAAERYQEYLSRQAAGGAKADPKTQWGPSADKEAALLQAEQRRRAG